MQVQEVKATLLTDLWPGQINNTNNKTADNDNEEQKKTNKGFTRAEDIERLRLFYRGKEMMDEQRL